MEDQVSRLEIIRTTEEALPGEEERRLQAARQKLNLILDSWRSRFTDEALDVAYGDSTIRSAKEGLVEISMIRQDGIMKCRYDSEAADQPPMVDFFSIEGEKVDTPTELEDPLSRYALLSEFLFACDRKEVRG